MKNVTITIDDETHRAARIRAAELGTSLSALVKDYLQTFCELPVETGVRDMAMTFAAQPAAIGALSVPNPNNAPYFVDGKWVFTKDGKPRKPGALRDMWVADDFDEWPADILASFEAWPYDDPGYVGANFDWPELPSE